MLRPGHAAASAADIEPAGSMARSWGRASSVGQHRAQTVLHDPVHGEPSYTCVTLYDLLIVSLMRSSMLRDASLFSLSVVALSVATLLAAWAHTSTEALTPNHVVDVVAWKVSKAFATPPLLGLAGFSAVAYESGTLFAVSSALPAVCSP
jgi:hypothetical protein